MINRKQKKVEDQLGEGNDVLEGDLEGAVEDEENPKVAEENSKEENVKEEKEVNENVWFYRIDTFLVLYFLSYLWIWISNI